MEYKFQDKLLQVSEEFIRLLKIKGISASIGEDSFRDYTAKVSVSEDDKSFGNVNLYYSPRRDSYSFRVHELKDKSIVPELEECWQQLSLTADDTTCEVHQIYVDGSFLDSSVGYGVVVLENGKVMEELFGSVPAAFVQGTRNVAGELFAARKAIQWCQENSIKTVSIFYDCEGVEKWAIGEWKARQQITQGYAEFIRNCGIHIRWHKVDSHTGNRWNDRADELAKKGAGSSSAGSDAAEDSTPELENKAKEFVQFLRDHGYDAELNGVYGNSDCAKIEVSEADKAMGYINIYRTKKIPFLPRYHELRDKSHEDKLDALWQEYHYGERQLPLQ